MENKKLLGAYVVFHNEESLLEGCLERLKQFVDQLVCVNHGSTDGSVDIAKKYADKLIDLEYTEPVDMGAVRTFCYQQMDTEWVLNVDADEYYPEDAMKKIREFVENPGKAISARVKYYNVACRPGYVQSNFHHYPDRLYKKEVVERVGGILPDDMHYVKKEYISAPNKTFGAIGILEYDNMGDKSFEHPRQPILDVTYFHLARSRGYNFEYSKRKKYEHFLHPSMSLEECSTVAKKNQWVNGLYSMEEMELKDIPKMSINDPKVSIIIPYYNYAKYIEKCVESCFSQTKQPHEVILVNDGSPDNIDEIVHQWKDYPNFIYIKKENAGESIARNIGGERATGDYVVFLDADDYIREDFIEKTLSTIGENDVCIPDMVVFNEANYNMRFPDYSWDELHKQQIMPSTCCLFRMEAWLNTKFDPNVLYCDWDIYLKLAHTGYKFTNCHEFLFFYNRKLDSNIAKLDARKEEGLNQLSKYSIQRR